MEASVTYGTSFVWGPQGVSILQLMSDLQNRGEKTVCQALDISKFFPGGTVAVPSCSVCAMVDSLKVDGQDISFCGKVKLNCTTPFLPIPIADQEIDIPCTNITDCKLFGCPGGCSGETCSRLGLCQCKKGYGPDCSIKFENNCISSKIIPKTCWSASSPDCDTAEFTLATENAPPRTTTLQLSKVNNISQIVPCLPLANTSCKICVDMDNIRREATSLSGCPKVKTSCGTVLLNTYETTCVSLSGDVILPQCSVDTTTSSSSTLSGGSTTDGPTNNAEPAWSTSKTALMAVVGLLAVAILAVLGYLAFGKFFGGIGQQNSFERVNGTSLVDELEPVLYDKDLGKKNGQLDDEDDDSEEDA